MPYDYKKEFNWGAYFGTWIWGLFNNSYIPLLHLLLFLTPLGWYFRLLCGLKGNECAYKNKRYDDVKLFNKSQEKQAFIDLSGSFMDIMKSALKAFKFYSIED